MFEFKCKKCSTDLVNTLFCENCGYLNLFPAEFNLFNLLGFKDILLNIDNNELEKKYLETLAQYHPDKFINMSAENQQNASLLSAKINEVYAILKKDSSRLLYIYEILFKEKLNMQTVLSTEIEKEFFQIHEKIQLTKNKKELEEIKKLLIKKRQAQLRKVSTYITNKNKQKITAICNYLIYIDKTIEMIKI